MSTLKDFRADAVVTPIRKLKPKSQSIEGKVLAIDQSLAHTGWAELVSLRGAINLLKTGTAKTASDYTGFEDSFQRGVGLFTYFEGLFQWMRPDYIVHESPGVGPRMRNQEDNIVACTAIRIAANTVQIPVSMIAVQSVRKILLGTAKADKNDVKAEVLKRYPYIKEIPGPRNQHTFDAIGIGLAFIERGAT